MLMPHIVHSQGLTYATHSHVPPEALLYVEAIASHATPVLADEALAGLLRIRGVREEHTFIPGSLFVLAHATWLCRIVSDRPKKPAKR